MSTESCIIREIYGLMESDQLAQALQLAGKPLLEARLLADRYSSVLVRCTTNGEHANFSLLQSAQREGLLGTQNANELVLSGPLAAWRAWLMRFPAEELAVGKVLATSFGVPVQPSLEVPWPGAVPRGWGNRPVIMGILNMTPDSFSDGGRYFNLSVAIERALAMVAEGADMLDIGGESTRPGAALVPAEEEVARVVPLIRAIRRQTNIPISVDTYKPVVAEQAIAAGADVVNDITGLGDAKMRELVARTKVPAIVMHMQGTPSTMQQAPHYTAVVAEVLQWLEDACRSAQQAGVSRAQLIIDPGIGFGKTTEQNLALINRLGDFRRLGYPVLLGTSRKSVIGNVLQLPVDQRVEGTAATMVWAVHERAEILRVHDVQQISRAVRMAHAVATEQSEWR